MLSIYKLLNIFIDCHKYYNNSINSGQDNKTRQQKQGLEGSKCFAALKIAKSVAEVKTKEKCVRQINKDDRDHQSIHSAHRSMQMTVFTNLYK